MDGIMFLKIINRFSMLFMIFNFLLYQGEILSVNIIIYIGFSFTSLAVYKLKKTQVGIWISVIFPLLIIIPSIVYNNKLENTILICIIALFAMIFNLKYNKNYYIGASKAEFVGGVSAVVVLMFLAASRMASVQSLHPSLLSLFRPPRVKMNKSLDPGKISR